MFFQGSRYLPVADAEWISPEGRVVKYKRRRIIPETPAPLGTVVRSGDRPDVLSYRVLGDPELFWMLCDANQKRAPADLTQKPGKTIGIPGPGGAP